ncbi:MAG TPA: GNAT family N-acetyltransferase [Pyrinomonadaceae bacterium]|jgi:ribosomal protein S18 acetylase RimI-like enzyme
MSMEEYKLSVEAEPDPQEVQFVVGRLISYNTSKAEPENYKPLAVFLRDAAESAVVGGLLGYTHWGWLYLSHVWLTEKLRGGGYGRRLIEAAEREAVSRGCRHAYLETHSFQARGFYEKLGYEVFGALEDYPAGETRYFLRKRNLA